MIIDKIIIIIIIIIIIVTGNKTKVILFYYFLSAEKVYSFQVFTPEFCKKFIEEISNFENTDLPKGRPNTMNNFGVRLLSFVFKDKLLES